MSEPEQQPEPEVIKPSRLQSLGNKIGFTLAGVVKLVVAVAVISVFSFFGKYTPEAFKKISDYWHNRVHKNVKRALLPITWTVGKALSLTLGGLHWLHHTVEHVATHYRPGKDYFAALKRHKTPEGVFFSTFFPGIAAALAVGTVNLALSLTTGMTLPWWASLALVKYTGGAIAFKGWVENKELIRSNHTLRVIDDYSQAAIDNAYNFAVTFINDFSVGALKGCEQFSKRVKKYTAWVVPTAIHAITYPFKKLLGYDTTYKPAPVPEAIAEQPDLAPITLDEVKSTATKLATQAADDIGGMIDYPDLIHAPAKTIAKVVLRDGVENIATKAIPDMFEAFQVEKAPLLGGVFKWSVYTVANLVSFGVNRILFPVIDIAAPIVDNTYRMVKNTATSDDRKGTAKKYIRYAGRMSAKRMIDRQRRIPALDRTRMDISRASPRDIQQALFGDAAQECGDKNRGRLSRLLRRPKTATPDVSGPQRDIK